MAEQSGNKGKRLLKTIALIILALAVVFAVQYVKNRLTEQDDPAGQGNTSNAVNVVDPEPGPNNNADPEPEPEPSGPVYYSAGVLDSLKGTEYFNKSAIEHIFMGTVNSNGKGSGYHYDMIKDSPGAIVEGTRSKEDKNGCYTANVTVDGHEKDHYSTFYPDDWTPQQVVDAILAARKDALDNDRHKGDTYIGYYNGIEINMYFDGKQRITSAYPIYSKK